MLTIPAATLGMYVVAVGAQIPDTVQAVAVARRGHGSMAVASAVASQVINILVGLGVPWFMTNAAGGVVKIPAHGQLQVMGCFTASCVVVYVACTLLPSIPTWGGKGHAYLDRRGGRLLVASYVATVLAYALATLLWWRQLEGVEPWTVFPPFAPPPSPSPPAPPPILSVPSSR